MVRLGQGMNPTRTKSKYCHKILIFRLRWTYICRNKIRAITSVVRTKIAKRCVTNIINVRQSIASQQQKNRGFGGQLRVLDQDRF